MKKRWIALCTTAVIGAGGFFAYKYVDWNKVIFQEFPFHLLVDEESEEEVVFKRVTGLDLFEKDVAEEKEMIELATEVASELLSISTTTNYMNNINNKQRLFEPMSEYLNESVSIDGYFQVLADIFKQEYREIQSITLTDITYSMNEVGEGQYEALMEVNAVEDDELFTIQPIKMLFDNNKKIKSIEKNGEVERKENTTTPLTTDTNLSSDTHLTFYTEFSNVIAEYYNNELYQRIKNGELMDDSKEVVQFLQTVGKDGISTETNKKLFHSINQEMNGFRLTSLTVQDRDIDSITIYEVKFPSTSEPFSIYVTYDRAKNEIIELTDK